MEQQPKAAVKPKRLYFKTYLQMIKNSVGTEMFRNFYLKSAAKGEFDGLDDGNNSCAFYVSGLLTLMKKAKGIHGTIASTLKDMQESGWVAVGNMREGDVLIWQAMDFDDGKNEHIGFYIGDHKAVSTSRTEKKVVVHDIYFGETNRQIDKIYRQNNW